MPDGNTGVCGTYAMSCARRRDERAVNGEPSTRIFPACGTTPAMARNNDDLPAPFGPIMHSHSPGFTVSVNAATAVRFEYSTLT